MDSNTIWYLYVILHTRRICNNNSFINHLAIFEEMKKFTIVIDKESYAWYVENEEFEYNGTFSVNTVTGAIHIEWYGIPKDLELWEEIEEELRKTLIVH